MWMDCIYTPQGEWTFLQCQKPCRPDSVFESRPYLDSILPNISNDGFIPEELVPKCPRCGSSMFGNVRAGNNFLHANYEAQNDALCAWMQSLVYSNAKVVVVEIGVGFNTPTVTRFPVESFVRELGERARLVRINPTEAFVPEDVNAMGIEKGWQVLGDIAASEGLLSESGRERAERHVRDELLNEDLVQDSRMTIIKYGQYFGHFDSRRFLLQLKNHL